MKKAVKVKKNKNTKELASYVNWRFSLICGAMLIGLIALLLRLGWLQVIHPEPLVKQGDLRSLRIEEISTARGMIMDRNGLPLAVSVPAYAVWADPKYIAQEGGIPLDKRWQAMAEALEISLDKIIEKVSQNPKGRFVYLERQVNPDIAKYISALELPGIHLQRESRRYYPTGEIMAPVIGITNIDGQGIEGVEKSFNQLLTGKPGERIVRKDRFGRVVEDVSSVDARAAHNITLSIDERLQAIAYRDLSNSVAYNKAESGSAVLIDVNTGEILAMANYPSYNPNNYFGTPPSHFRDRAITDIFEPGSTVKPMVMMQGLRKKIINVNSIIDTRPYYIAGHQIKDVGFYSELTMMGILQKSSNVGISKIALSMPPRDIMDVYSDFGFGKPTDLGLIGESSGIFPQDKKRWSDLSRATFSFGYGLMVTPLQLARAYATMGSFGIYRPLSINKVDPPVLGIQVFPKKIVQEVVHMMETVALPGGGGIKASVKGYRVAVKTGTAKKVGPNGKYIDQYIAYTAGIAPASHPRFALVVVINNPQGDYYGGAVSAPVFSEIMGNTLRVMNVEPDAISGIGHQELVINNAEGNTGEHS